jgi:hypothetical protein
MSTEPAEQVIKRSFHVKLMTWYKQQAYQNQSVGDSRKSDKPMLTSDPASRNRTSLKRQVGKGQRKIGSLFRGFMMRGDHS